MKKRTPNRKANRQKDKNGGKVQIMESEKKGRMGRRVSE